MLALAALGLAPPAIVLGPRATAVPVTVSVPDAAPAAIPDTAEGVDQAEQHPDRYDSHPHLVRRSAP